MPKAAAKVKAKTKNKPRYDVMIARALNTLTTGNKTLISIPALAKEISSRYPVKESVFRRNLRKALQRGVAANKLVQVRQSYRLSKKSRGIKKPVKRKAPKEKPEKEKRVVKEKKKAKDKRDKPVKRTKKADKEEVNNENNNNNNNAAAPRKKVAAPKKPRLVKGASKVVEALSKEEVPKEVKKPADAKFSHRWEYCNDQRGWSNYDTKASDVLEGVYQGYLANKGDTDVRAVKSGQWEYQVDFMAMKQTNIQHANHTVRDIRRVPYAQ